MKKKNIKISVVIPAKNEEAVLKKMVSLLLNNFNRSILEIIIVNDCSTDNTRKILTRLVKQNGKVKALHRRGTSGVGNAIRSGLKIVSETTDYVLLLDCDFIENTANIKRMIQNAHSADGLLGSRYMRKGQLVNYPILKKVANRFFHTLLLFILGISHKDISNNFKLYRYDVVKRIYPFLKSNGFSINAETGIYPVLVGYRLKEIPVSWVGRTTEMGKSHFNVLRAGPGYVRVLFEAFLFKYVSGWKYLEEGTYAKRYQKS